MSIKELDYFFPFFVLGYGVLITLLFESGLIALGNGRIPEPMLQQLKGNRVLGLICLVVGLLWSLQNLWVT